MLSFCFFLFRQQDYRLRFVRKDCFLCLALCVNQN